LWDISSKEKFAGPETVETAYALAVCLFSGGAKPLQMVLKGLHLETGEHCRSGFITIDQQRLYAAGQKTLDATKVRCQIHRSQRKSQNEQNEEPEVWQAVTTKRSSSFKSWSTRLLALASCKS